MSTLSVKYFFLLLLFTIPTVAQDLDIRQQVQDTLAPLIEGSPHRAMVVGYIREGKKTVFSLGEAEASEETVFDIGSITKVFTGIALSKAILDEGIKNDTSVCEMMPELFGEGNALCQMTIEELATHHSGFPRLPTNLNMFSNSWNPFGKYDEEKLKEFVQEWEGYKDEEHSYLYSNIGAGLMGYLLVQHFGLPGYDALLQETLLDELGMQSTSTQIMLSNDDRRIQGYNQFGIQSADWTGETLAGMGLLRSNMADMMTFLKAMMDLPSHEDQGASPLQKVLQLSMTPLKPIRLDGSMRVAYFWHILQSDEGHQFWWHNGMTGGYTSFLAFDPVQKVGMVVLLNQADGDLTARCMSLLDVL